MRHAAIFGVACLILTLFTGCVGARVSEGASDWPAVAERIRVQMSKADRHKYDLPRDPHRKPVEMYRILGVRTGMTIGDFGSGAGYNVELFAAAVGSSGRVWGHNSEFIVNAQNGYYKRAMHDRTRNSRLPNADNMPNRAIQGVDPPEFGSESLNSKLIEDLRSKVSLLQ